MIGLFRRIRKKLADDNKPMKYMRYAIGEIVLVMVGILLALQVNNWNESRKQRNEERTIITNIHNEFVLNKRILENSILSIEQSYSTSREIFNLVGKDRDELSKVNIDSLFFYSLEFASFQPSENTVIDLVQSGRLNLIQNEELKKLRYDWTMALEAARRGMERAELKIDDVLVPYLSKRYALKDIDIYGGLNWRRESTLKVDKFKIFEEVEFESILDDYLYRIIGSITKLKDLEIVIDEIIEVTKTD